MNSFEDEIKNFKILVVEDEKPALNLLGKFFKRIFNNVVLCENGLDGFLAFKDSFDKSEKFDLIISDINMPKMDGLKMIEKIRQTDNNVATIFLTARSESNQIIRAINLHIDNYILKPINLDIVDEKVKKLCKELYYKKIYEYQRIEIENYMHIIEDEALIIKFDLEGHISFVNKSYCLLSGYTKDELIGTDFINFRHPDTSITIIENIWENLIGDESWEGKSKNITKDGRDCFFNSKIMPIYDTDTKEIKEFISINFLITEEETRKREKNKNFLKQISIYKTQISKLKEDYENLKQQMEFYKNNEDIYTKRYLSYEEKIKYLNQQVYSYEKNSLENNKLDIIKEKGKNKQFETIKNSLLHSESKNKQLINDIDELKSILENKDNLIVHYRDTESESLKRIENLTELVTNLQDENENLKDNKSFFNLKK
jgi:PAS domain S-box-containing protein